MDQLARCRPGFSGLFLGTVGVLFVCGFLARAEDKKAEAADADSKTPNTLTEQEKAAGWKLLFDGKTTAGWRAFRGKSMPDKWHVVDGALVLQPRSGKQGGDIVTEDQYGSFDLKLEWKISPGGNSGIMYHVSESEAAPWFTGPEYQVLDNAKHADGRNPLTSAASCYALYAPTKDSTRPVGEWNQARIVVRGKHVEHWLNGEKVVSYEFDSPDWNDRVKASKFKEMPKFGKEPKGYIDLQDHGDEVAYRNIKIRPLTEGEEKPGEGAKPPEGATVLFDGMDLSGWTRRSQKLRTPRPPNWGVKEGYLEVSPGDGDIITKAKFGPDFQLHVEFWLPLMPKAKGQGRANSGVFLQGRYEIQVLDSYHNETYANGACGALYGIIAPSKNANKPPEQWQTYDITLHAPRVDTDGKVIKKGHVTVVQNGETIIDHGEFDKVTGGALDEKIGEPGPLLLQDHGCKVRFRNIWLKPLGE
jgi:hypothetical protein